nr:DUF2339 domain-containing protein [uncultured Enterobacter sp.]
MDGLLVIGGIVLFFMAVTALNRNAALRNELAALREKVSALDARLATTGTLAPPDATAEPVATIATAEPVATIATTHSAPPPAPAHSAAKPDIFNGVMHSLVRWFMQGNPLAKVGIVLLFIGIAFLLRYTAEHARFPLEWRLATTALGAMGLLALGWRLRHKQPVYALILQGGSAGALYLTVFGAFRLWHMLPVSLAFGLLLVICAASVGLALLQNALSLAMLASLGGYLAPLLLSDGAGHHVVLFAFYLLLSSGILTISVWRHWRELNLLGLFFTFGVGGVWGVQDHQPAYYVSCQILLIANVLLFGVGSVLLSLRAQGKGKRLIDGVLVFVPPLLGFGMQVSLTQFMPNGPGLSALGFGIAYLSLAWLALRRYPSLEKSLGIAALALGCTFATLAIPLAFSARWTAMAWALEGLGVLWLGVQQQQLRMSYSGTGLLILAFGSGIWALTHSTTLFSAMMIFTVLSLCWLAAAWLWRVAQQHTLSDGLLAGGIAFWLVALAAASQQLLHNAVHPGFGILALLALSVWGWRYVSLRLSWTALGSAQWLLWPGMLLMLFYQIRQGDIFTAGWENLAWLMALPCACLLLFFDGHKVEDKLSQGLHVSLFWMILLALLMELFWFARGLPAGMEAWRSGILMAAGGVTVIAVCVAIRFCGWPFACWPGLYGSLALAPVLALLVPLLLLANLQNGIVTAQPYLPLLNPLEGGAALGLVGLFLFTRRVQGCCAGVWMSLRPVLPILTAACAFWWLNGMLLRALAYYGDINWAVENLWHSRGVQTAFALFWMLVSLVIMVTANRTGTRKRWFSGAALLLVVIVKLMLIDSARGGGLARAVAFIGVAILVLIVGYFSPLPPKEADA